MILAFARSLAQAPDAGEDVPNSLRNPDSPAAVSLAEFVWQKVAFDAIFAHPDLSRYDSRDGSRNGQQVRPVHRLKSGISTWLVGPWRALGRNEGGQRGVRIVNPLAPRLVRSP